MTPCSPHISLLVFPHLIATEFVVKYNKCININRHIQNFISNVVFSIFNQICTEFIRININAAFLHFVPFCFIFVVSYVLIAYRLNIHLLIIVSYSFTNRFFNQLSLIQNQQSLILFDFTLINISLLH